LWPSKIWVINKNLVSSEAHSTGLCDVSKYTVSLS
jgi:hypothetical protein